MDEIRYAKMCPRFNYCSANRCPLDLGKAARTDHPKDPRRVCQQHLRERLGIVARATIEGVDILGGGLTRAEIATGLPVPTLVATWDARKDRQRAQVARLNPRLKPSPSGS